MSQKSETLKVLKKNKKKKLERHKKHQGPKQGGMFYKPRTSFRCKRMTPYEQALSKNRKEKLPFKRRKPSAEPTSGSDSHLPWLVGDEELDELLKKETKKKQTVYQPPDGLELILQKMGLKTGGCHILSF